MGNFIKMVPTSQYVGNMFYRPWLHKELNKRKLYKLIISTTKENNYQKQEIQL